MHRLFEVRLPKLKPRGTTMPKSAFRILGMSIYIFPDVRTDNLLSFLLVVMGAYKQIRAQSQPVLSDVDEENFDRAFSIIRPVIQGTADAGKRLTENELQKTMDFCKHIFSPTDPEMHEAVGARVDPSLFSPEGPVMTPEDLDRVLDPTDEDARAVLQEVNARKPVHIMYNATGNFDVEDVNGWKVTVKRGNLGLRRA